MIRINLLPHREAKKAKYRRYFYMLCTLTLVSSFLLCSLCYLLLGGMVSSQQDSNQHLSKEITKLDADIKTITSLKKEKEALLSRKNLVEGLQNSRGDAVKLFDQIIRQTPDGIYLSKLEQKGGLIKLSGFGLSNARVSAYMDALSKSDLFSNPELIETKSELANNRRLNSFVLTVEMKTEDVSKPLSAR